MKTRSMLLCASALSALAGSARATDLNLRVESYGKHLYKAFPGEVVRYHVTGLLSDGASQGLAMYAFDLEFEGGALPQADAPTASPMTNFASPLGLNNPAGFGGTQIDMRLVQVGGAQNTIRNQFAPQPTGTVITGVAQPGERALLATGTLTAPLVPGDYFLAVENVVANVIRAGETGDPFWRVDPAGRGVGSPLTIRVEDCGPQAYCTAKANSQGCLPAIGWSGTPTIGGADDFHLTASNVINNQFGVLFWGDAPANVPFMGGIRCVAMPIVRTPNQPSGGNPPPPDCSGTFDFHFSHAYMASQGLAPGDDVYTQYWYRDPAHSDGTGIGLTNGAAFMICP